MDCFEVKNLCKRYKSIKSLNNFSIQFKEGQIIGLIGPNGSGKTTLMRILSGLLHQTSGEIIYKKNLNQNELKKIVAYMPTKSHLYPWMTINQIIQFYDDFFESFDKQKVHKTIDKFNISPKIHINKLLPSQIGVLKVILNLARKAKLYLIDEPFAGIDPVTRTKIIDILANEILEDKCIVISNNSVDSLEKIIEGIIFINNGQLILEGNINKLESERQLSIQNLYKELYKNV